MKPHKHPLLFSVLALTLVCLLINASIVQVSGVAPLVAILGAIGAGVAGGIIGWFIHDVTSKQSETPGVDLDSYVFSVTDRWETDIENAANYLRSITETLTWAKEYYSRVASYKAGEYLDKESLDLYEEDFMRDIAYDLYSYYKNLTIESLRRFANELARFQEDRLTGDLQGYRIFLGDYGSYSGNAWLDSLSSEIKPVYKWTGVFRAWIFGSVTLGFIDADYDQEPDGCGTFTFTGVFNNKTYSVDVDSSGWTTIAIEEGIYDVSFTPCNGFSNNGLIAMDNVLIISDTQNLYPGFAAKFDTIRFGRNFEVWHEGNLLKDIDISEVWYVILNEINHLDLIYDTAFNSARMVHENCRNAGFTDPSQADQCLFIHVPPTVAFPTIQELLERYGENYDEMLANWLARLQKINETFAKLKEDFAGMISDLNLSFADVREHFENVLLKIGNQTLEIQKLIPLWITQAQKIFANASNVLQGMMGALAIFKNGTVKYIVIPPGSTLTPQAISTPNGLVPSLDLQNWIAGMNPAYTPGNYTEPTFVTPADETIQVTFQLLFAILPLLLLLAVVNMITNLGKRR